VRELLGALHVVHSQQVLHCDLKPGNVFLTRDGRPVLIDFGSARVDYAWVSRGDPTSLQVTGPYCAPEIAEGSTDNVRAIVDGRTDVSGAALVLWNALTGSALFADESNPLEAHAYLEPRAPSELAGESIPSSLDAVVLRALAKDPRRRFRSVAEFNLALAQ